MKTLLIKTVALASLAVFFSACAPTAGQQNGGLSEADVRNIVAEELAKYQLTRDNDRRAILCKRSEKGLSSILKTRRRCQKAEEQANQRIENYSIDDDPGLVIPMRQ